MGGWVDGRGEEGGSNEVLDLVGGWVGGWMEENEVWVLV